MAQPELRNRTDVAVDPRSQPARILVVDDDDACARGLAGILRRDGGEVMVARNVTEARAFISTAQLDVVVSDMTLPDGSGIDVLDAAAALPMPPPVIFVTGVPSVSTAAAAVERRATRYLVKPVDTTVLRASVRQAVREHRDTAADTSQVRLRAPKEADLLDAAFDRAIDLLYMAYQPIVRPSDKTIFGYEALVRTREPTFPHPGALFDAAEKLNRIGELSRTIRRLAPALFTHTPGPVNLFLNMHAHDLTDESLVDDCRELAIPARTVLELSERCSVDDLGRYRDRLARLRAMGFRIAIDDLGAGYAGLTSFAMLEPEIVKLDMALVRDVDRAATKQRVIRSLATLCKEMDVTVVAEGVETRAESQVLGDLGCELQQGYLFARPGAVPPIPTW